MQETKNLEFGTCLALFLSEPICTRHFRQARQAGFNRVEIAANYQSHMRGTRREIELTQRSFAGDTGGRGRRTGCRHELPLQEWPNCDERRYLDLLSRL